MGPWVEYSSPDDFVPEYTSAPPTRKARRLLTPSDGEPFFVQGEYDDGNGMWIITGVSH